MASKRTNQRYTLEEKQIIIKAGHESTRLKDASAHSTAILGRHVAKSVVSSYMKDNSLANDNKEKTFSEGWVDFIYLALTCPFLFQVENEDTPHFNHSSGD